MYRVVTGKSGSADMWRIVIRFVEIVSNSNRRIRIKGMCGFWIEINGRIRSQGL